MRMMRKISFGLAALAFTTIASAQFDGPAPLAWRFQASLANATGTPLVEGDRVYYPNGGRIVAIDKDTGNKRWQYPAVEKIDGNFKGSPLMFDGSIVAAADNKIIYAIDAKGESKWSYTATDPIIGQIVASGKYIAFQMSGNRLMVLNGSDGTPLWDSSYNNPSGISGGIAIHNDNILFFNFRNDLVSINLVTRKTNWTVPLQSLATNTAPVVAEDTIYVNSGSAIVALNANTHQLRWQKVVPTRMVFSPTVNEEGVFLTTGDGMVLGWSLTGQELSKKPLTIAGTTPSVKPTAVGHLLFVPTTNGLINLVDVPNSKLLWSYQIRPTAEYVTASQNPNSGAGAGFNPGGLGGGRNGGGQTSGEKPFTVSASAPVGVFGSTLLVPARDGSLLAFDKNVGVDLTPPKVTMLFPNPGDQVSGQPPLQLWFRFEDEASGVNADSLLIEIDGVKMDTKLERDGTAIVRFSQTGKNRLLSIGRKTISVTVSDWLGNIRKQTYALTIDNTLRPVVLPGTSTNNGLGGGFNPGAGGGGDMGGKGGG